MQIGSTLQASSSPSAQADATAPKDLLATLRSTFPGLTVAIGELPGDDKEQEKLAMAGKLAGLTVHPAAADRMQSDAAFRDKVIAGIKADQAKNAPGSTQAFQGQAVEIVGHGTVVEKDGTINSWTLSKTTTTVGKDDSAKEKKTLLEALRDRLKQQRDAGNVSQQRYDEVVQEAEQMRAAGKSEEEVAAKLREAYLASQSPSSSVGVETTA